MRANSRSTLHLGVLSFCLLLTSGCAPDQFVSMGSDLGGSANQADATDGVSGSGGTTSIGEESSAASRASGGTHFDGQSNSSTTAIGFGGSSEVVAASATAGTPDRVIGVLR